MRKLRARNAQMGAIYGIGLAGYRKLQFAALQSYCIRKVKIVIHYILKKYKLKTMCEIEEYHART